ncbi:MAG: VWA domain-containing protein [Acidobacteria bacterium]|nr:VWA domain-containing protein [Acidobacteriota bacterium]
MNGKELCLVVSILLLCIGNIGTQNVTAQTEPQEEIRGGTFKVSSRLVEIRAVVTDKKGRIVENLKGEDFELLENSRPQETDFFSVTRVADETNPPDEPEKKPESKKTPSVSTREQLKKPSPRTAALFVDNLHLHFDTLNWVKTNLHRFIDENLNPQDMVALVTSDTDLGIAQQFTRNRQILRYAVDNIAMGYIQRKSRFTPYLAALVDRSGSYIGGNDVLNEARAIYEAEEGLEDQRYSLTRARAREVLFETSWRRKTTLDALKDLIDQMIEVPGQRMIVIFSEGFSQFGRDAEYKDMEVKAVIERALQSGVVIYSVDAKGLDADIGEIFNTSHYHFAAREEILDSLSDLARETGGELYRFTNNFSDTLVQAMNANRYYYNLGYYLKPGDDAPDTRDIRVRIRNHPEYKVRIQRGRMPLDLVENRDEENENLSPQQRLLKAVNSPVPKADLAVSAQLYFIRNKTDDKQVSLTVFLEGDDLQYKEQGQRHTFDIEMVYVIYDSDGKQVEAFTNDIQGDLKPERLAQARKYGYWYTKRLALEPGVYQARVGIREKDTGRMGTAMAWVEVPDLEKSSLALSSLVLLDLASANTEDSGDINAGDLNRVRTVQGIRLYRQNEICGYFFSLYHDMDDSDDSNLELKMELLNGTEAVRWSEWRPLSIDQKNIDEKGWAYIGEKIHLAGLTPGIYELRVSVKDKKETIQRIATLGIE